MPVDLTILAAITAVGVSLLAFWSNPKRTINRLFVALSVHAAVWLLCLGEARQGGGPTSQMWMRLTTAVGALLPLHLWIIKEVIAMAGAPLKIVVARSRWWALVCGCLAVISFTEWFVPTQIGEEVPPFGIGYYIYTVCALGLYLLLWQQTVRQIRATAGVTKIELQLVLLGGTAAALAVILLMALRALFETPWLMNLRPVVVLLFYTGTVIAITTTRILDARQIFAIILQKACLIVAVALVVHLGHRVLAWFFPEAIAFIAIVALALWFAAALNGWLDRLLRFYPQGVAARQAAFTAAQRETRLDSLERAFRSVLKGWGQAEHAIIASGNKDLLTGEDVEVRGDDPVVQAMRHLRWATPERLTRERATPERDAVTRFLETRNLGVLVFEQGPALSVLIGVGTSASRRPFTYPQVAHLMELASIMESALERAHFSAKVQHTEQLATVGLLGASLAHEIRNPLVSIKTFVQLLPTHHHDPRFREKFFKLIGDEVGRIDQLTEQLLDLASPRTYEAKMVELHPVLRASLDLIAAKAAHRDVQLLTEFDAAPDAAYTDASAAKQVMLNLCFNAIQAVETVSDGARWVKIVTRNTNAGIEMAVADSGPGIAAEIRPRLFQPFQTTKSTGFGLGLAICSDILANLNASISVDPPAPGCGATFRVTFPCQPLSS